MKIIHVLIWSIFTFLTTYSSAQEFILKDTLTLVNLIIDENLVYNIRFHDRDSDGDSDLFLSTIMIAGDEYSFDINYQENIGSPSDFKFTDPIPAFSTLNYPYDILLPAFGDLNNDHKTDMVIMAQADSITGLQHPVFYLSTDDGFTKLYNEDFDLDPILPNRQFFPELTDMDNDGDLDLLLSGGYTLEGDVIKGQVLYAKNIGTPDAPELLGWFNYPYGLGSENTMVFYKTADIDGDGDLDAIGIANADTITNIIVQKNVSEDIHRPVFSEIMISPYGLPHPTEESIFIDVNAVDFDGDLDLDILISTFDQVYFIQSLYYENIQCNTVQDEFVIEICEGESFEGYTEEGIYSDIFVSNNGCDSTRILDLRINPIYEIEIGNDYCEGDEIIFNGEAINSSGSYLSNLSTNKGCDSTVILNAIFEEVQPPITQEGNVLSTSEEFVTYQWINCQTGEEIAEATSPSFSPEISGNYGVKVISISGCIGTSECLEMVISSNENLETRLITIFPNPASDILLINSKQSIKDIKIYNIKGELVLTPSISNEYIIEVDKLDPGVYVFQARIGKRYLYKKLVITTL